MFLQEGGLDFNPMFWIMIIIVIFHEVDCIVFFHDVLECLNKLLAFAVFHLWLGSCPTRKQALSLWVSEFWQGH